MEELQEKYVPTHSVDTEMVNCECMHKVLFGGDQVTVARARSGQMGRRNEVTPTQQLRGLVPIVEDWHARMTFLEVC